MSSGKCIGRVGALPTGQGERYVLHERASEQPDALAYTHVDHDIDPGGLPESLTRSQVHQQAQRASARVIKWRNIGAIRFDLARDYG
jgi:hypothetical protein